MEKTTEKPKEIETPKDGVRFEVKDQGRDLVFVLNPLSRQAFSYAGTMARAGKAIEGTIGIINMLKVQGSDDPNEIQDVRVLRGLELALAEWMEPEEVVIKKN